MNYYEAIEACEDVHQLHDLALQMVKIIALRSEEVNGYKEIITKVIDYIESTQKFYATALEDEKLLDALRKLV